MSSREPTRRSRPAGRPRPASEPEAFFDALAGRWEAEHGPDSPRGAGFRAITAFLEELVAGFPEPPTMLDVGCATGAHLRALAPRLALGVGVDLSPAMIEAARAAAEADACPGLRFLVADAARLEEALAGTPELAAQRFDLVTLIGTLEHIPDRPAALAAAARRLVPGTGRLVVIAPHPLSPGLLAARLARGGRAPRLCASDRHLTPGALRRLAASVGLEPAGLRRLDLPVWHGGGKVPPALRLLSALPLPRAFAALFRRPRPPAEGPQSAISETGGRAPRPR